MENEYEKNYIYMTESLCYTAEIKQNIVNQLCYAMLSHFSRVRLCATPEMAAHPGSPVPGILQARTLEWVSISFSDV